VKFVMFSPGGGITPAVTVSTPSALLVPPPSVAKIADAELRLINPANTIAQRFGLLIARG
jgi:hypothetical protein